jgi:tRNA dimethylallyltransferase
LGKPAFVVGGSGMYVKALTHGLSELPPANVELRSNLSDLSAAELLRRLEELDPATARVIDPRNKHRLIRAVEVCLLTGRPVSAQRQRPEPAVPAAGVFVFRERAELYARIDARVHWMFANGVVEEVRAAPAVGSTAAKTLGLREIRDLLAGRISERECIAAIQQATRRYAKRQLTWFQHQTTFEPLNLSSNSATKAVEWIAQKARLSFSHTG